MCSHYSESKKISQKRAPFYFESKSNTNDGFTKDGFTNDSEYFIVFREVCEVQYNRGLHGHGKVIWSKAFFYYFDKGFQVEISILGESSRHLLFTFEKLRCIGLPDYKAEIGLRYFIKEDELLEDIFAEEIVVQDLTAVLGKVSLVSKVLPDNWSSQVPVVVYICVEFVVKIPNETKSFVKDFSKLLGNPEFSDFKIVCDEVSFPCHKNILASRSDVFSAMFKMANTVENNTRSVHIKDISAKTMKAFLKFVYQCKASESDLDIDLLVAADKYNISELVLQCEDQILSGLTENNALDILALGTMSPTKRIHDEVVSYIRHNCDGEFNKNGERWAKLKTANPSLAIELLEGFIGYDEKEETKSENPKYWKIFDN
jgi:hypothetical protein